MTETTTAPAVLRAASTHPCACGCGQLTGGDWAPGHDGRAKGLLRAVARGERTVESLPGRIAELVSVLVPRWGLGAIHEGQIVWSEQAKAPTTKRPAASHPAMRTLLRAKDQLADKPDLAELVAEIIEALNEAAV